MKDIWCLAMLNLDPIETIVYFGDYKGSNQCPICKFRLLNPQYMKKHIYIQHLKYKWLIDLNEQREKARTTDPIPCPYCGELLYDLSRHITVVHNKTLRQFHLEFPTTPLTSLRKATAQDLNCEICGKSFKFKNVLGKHIKDCHPEVFNANRQKENEEYRLKYKDTHTCPICNQKKFNLIQHVHIKHKMDWDEFCKVYNWDVNDTCIMTDTHKEKLSENKLKFYQSDRGLKLRKKHRQDFSCQNNPACKPEARLKISQNAIKRMNENPFFSRSYGIKFEFNYRDNHYSVRSFEELKTLLALLINKIDFEYESCQETYDTPEGKKTYLPDFIINGSVFELKSSASGYYEKGKMLDKYEFIQEHYRKKGISFYIVSYNTLKKLFNLKINYNIYELCKDMLDSDNMKITHINFHKNSTILSNITPDYKSHKNIIFKTLTKGKKMQWKDIKSAEVISHEGFVYDIELKDNHYFASNNIISHNCRLRNEVTNNEFSYSLGAGGVATGSKNVITININRLIQDNRDIVEEVRKVHKYQLAFEDLYQEYFKSNMMPLYSGGFISLDKQYLTVGINGVVEAAEYLGYEISNNQPYKDWVSSLLKKIYDENRKAAKEYGVKFNTEFTPCESLGAKNAMWDKADGYKVPRDCYNSYLYKVEDNEISVLDKFALHGKQTTQYLDGGSAYHCNLESYPTQEGFKKLIDVAVKEGCEYFCFNVLITGCDDCGHIDKQTLQQCPKCKSKNIWHATRVIGYLKKISDFSTARQNEASLRYYDTKTK